MQSMDFAERNTTCPVTSDQSSDIWTGGNRYVVRYDADFGRRWYGRSRHDDSRTLCVDDNFGQEDSAY